MATRRKEIVAVLIATEDEKRKVIIDFEKRIITLPLLDNQYESLKNDPTYQIYDFRLEIFPKAGIKGEKK
jgi:hypothetical protein